MPSANTNAKGMKCGETCKNKKFGKCTLKLVHTDKLGNCLEKK